MHFEIAFRHWFTGSVIHVLPDQIQQCSAVLSSMLPRESFSKVLHFALLTQIVFAHSTAPEISQNFALVIFRKQIWLC